MLIGSVFEKVCINNCCGNPYALWGLNEAGKSLKMRISGEGKAGIRNLTSPRLENKKGHPSGCPFRLRKMGLEQGLD